MNDITIQLGDILEVIPTYDPLQTLRVGDRYIVQGITKRIGHTDFQIINEEASDPDDEITLEPWLLPEFKNISQGV